MGLNIHERLGRHKSTEGKEDVHWLHMGAALSKE